MNRRDLRTAEFKADTMARQECEGACEIHKGIPRLVSVTDLSGEVDWGYFKYCEQAIADDESHGLLVKTEYEA